MASGIRLFQQVQLPTSLPVFPLPGALLLPGGRLPLNIFEPRYLAMIEDAMAAGRMFGMIQPDAIRPEGETGPALFRVGCLGRITSFGETEDGRMVLSLLGLTRFTVEEELPMRLGYRRLRVSYDAFCADLTPMPSDTRVGLPRENLLAALQGYFTNQGLNADWEAINALEDEELLTALCMMCPFAPSEKQALLEAESLPARCDILLALLAFGLHGTDDDSGTQRLS